MAEEQGIILNEIVRTSSGCTRRHVDLEQGEHKVEQGVSSLPLMLRSESTNTETLMSRLKNKPGFIRFLLYSGNYWPDADEPSALRFRTLFVVVRLMVLLGSAFSLALVGSNKPSIWVLFYITTFLDFVSVIPGQYYNQLRLHQPSTLLDATVLDECIRITSYFAAFSVCVVFISAITGSMVTNALYDTAVVVPLYAISSVFIVMYLCFNMLMLLIDVKVSSLEVDQLIILCDKKALTMETFNTVRDNIHRRVNSGKWATDIIIVPCIASGLMIVLFLYYIEEYSNRYNDVALFVAVICLLSKELIFVAIAFWYVAKINGKADELTVKLSRTIWAPSVDYVPDIERLSLYASSVMEPISFMLLFRRLSWQNVAVSAASFGITALVGIVKYLAGMS